MADANTLRTWVSKGKIEETLYSLRLTTEGSLRNEVVQLAARYHEHQRQQRLNLSSAADLGVELARIQKSLLDIIDECTQQDIDKFPDLQGFEPGDTTEKGAHSQVRLIWSIVVVSGIFLVIILIYHFSNCCSSKNLNKLNQTTVPKSDSSIVVERPTAKVKRQNRSFCIRVSGDVSQVNLDSLTVRATSILLPLKNGRACFTLPPDKNGIPIEILIEKSGIVLWREWLDKTETEKEIKIDKRNEIN